MALVNERARILSNAGVGPSLYLMTLEAPQIAAAIEPGQFVHMKVPGMEAHILRRPFSVYARDGEAGTLEILYQAVGFGSAHMTKLRPTGPLRATSEPWGRSAAPGSRRRMCAARCSWAAAWVRLRCSCWPKAW